MWYIIDGKDLRPEDQLVSVKELEDRLSKFETEVEQDIDQKVSDLSTSFVTKEPGKGLSSNDYTSTEKEQVATIEDKVDKVQGKQLSTEDYTTQEKQKLAELENYDDTDILSDISSLDSRVSDNEDAISLLNGDKLTSGSVLNTVDIEIAKVVADAPASFDTLKEIADWIADHPEDTTVMNAQIQQNKSDISSLDTSKANKSTTYTKDEVNSLLPNELADLTDDSTHRLVTDTEKTAWNSKSDFSGDYNDLTNKPTIPVVPTNISSFTNDSNYQNATQVQTAINNAIGTALGGSY